MPLTIQTSPLHVEMAARPSEKKSSPPKRIHDLYGFLNGGVSESMVYAVLSSPRLPCVVTVSVKRALAPLVKGVRSMGLPTSAIALAPASHSGCGPLQTQIHRRVG